MHRYSVIFNSGCACCLSSLESKQDCELQGGFSSQLQLHHHRPEAMHFAFAILTPSPEGKEQSRHFQFGDEIPFIEDTFASPNSEEEQASVASSYLHQFVKSVTPLVASSYH